MNYDDELRRSQQCLVIFIAESVYRFGYYHHLIERAARSHKRQTKILFCNNMTQNRPWRNECLVNLRLNLVSLTDICVDTLVFQAVSFRQALVRYGVIYLGCSNSPVIKKVLPAPHHILATIVLALNVVLILYVMLSVTLNMTLSGVGLVDSLPIVLYILPLMILLPLMTIAYYRERTAAWNFAFLIVCSVFFGVLSSLIRGFLICLFLNIISAVVIYIHLFSCPFSSYSSFFFLSDRFI